MPKVEQKGKGFNVVKDSKDLKKESVREAKAKRKGKNAQITTVEERLERMELMLELLCEEKGIEVE